MPIGRIIIGLAVVAAVAAAIVLLRPHAAPASGSGPGMSLSGPSAVSTGETFTIEVNADPPPDVPIAGFASEVLLPPGLSWMQRPMCEDENESTVNGDEVGTCIRAEGPDGAARHVVISSIAEPPLAALDTPLNTLVEVDVRCTAPGAYTLVLTAVGPLPLPGMSTSGYSHFGAVYFETSTQPILVGTENQDVDGDTDVGHYADVLTVTCTGTKLTPPPCPSQTCPTPTETFLPAETPPPDPGMSLNAPEDVTTGEVFTLSIHPDPLSIPPPAGFKTEVILPPALSWLPRDRCFDENQTTSGGHRVAACGRNVLPGGAIRHGVTGSFEDVHPLPSLDTPLDVLLELDLVCSTPGRHTVVLTAAPYRANGARLETIYWGTAYLVTTPYDIDGNTTNENVADTRLVECTGESYTPLPTITPFGFTPPPAATPTATPTPPSMADGISDCIDFLSSELCSTDPGSDADTVSDSGPGMSLSGPSTVATGQTFAIDINANPPPGVPVGGFSTEVVFPPGLSWIQRPTCEAENQKTVNGGDVGVCVRGEGPDGEARHVIISEVVAPPLRALDTPLGTLIQIDVLCTAPGSHTMTLTAVSGSPTSSSFGAIYFDINTNQVRVKTQPYDIDGNTDIEQVADTLTVNCAGTPPPTTPCAPEGCPSPTPTRTPVIVIPPENTRTPTPCSPDGCPTAPPTPTFPPPPTPTPCDQSGCPPPGMTLSGPSSVVPNQNFTLRISAGPSPAVGIGGFATEIVLPSGLKWQQRSTCRAEVLARVNGAPPGSCVRAFGQNNQVRHVAITAISAPPLPSFDMPLGPLAEVDIRCNTPGVHTLVLTAVPGSSFGAVLFDINTLPIELATTPYDVDGDTVMEYVADTYTVICSFPASPTPCPTAGCPTPTRTPSPTRTQTPTPTPCAPGGCPLPGMTLSGPPSVVPSQTFTLRINADPEPSVAVGGLATEILLPDGLEWMQRSTCEDESQATWDGHESPCYRVLGPNGEARHFIGPSIGPPWPPLDQPLASLLEIDIRCNTPGVHTLVLTAVPDSSFGAIYFAAQDSSLTKVRTTPYDIDGDTVPEDVADTHTINCSIPPCPTDTGPVDGECVPHTPTPVVETPAGETPEETPDVPAPSPTLFSEVDPDPAIITPTQTDFSEVSPALATPAGAALDDVQSPDAGDGEPSPGNGASLVAIGLLVAALFAFGAASLRRLGRTD